MLAVGVAGSKVTEVLARRASLAVRFERNAWELSSFLISLSLICVFFARTEADINGILRAHRFPSHFSVQVFAR